MIISFGCDHAGFEYREKIFEFLKQQGFKIIDCGTFSVESCDYPDIASCVAKTVSSGESEKGILLCGTGIGVCITANKFSGARAALAYSEETARLASQHNNANILCLGARTTSLEDIIKYIKVWIETPFEGQRHQTRVDKIKKIDERNIR
ncbi:MAG: ribose 5-phosphate isomerase B [Elusimicrobiota bacterium]